MLVGKKRGGVNKDPKDRTMDLEKVSRLLYGRVHVRTYRSPVVDTTTQGPT